MKKTIVIAFYALLAVNVLNAREVVVCDDTRDPTTLDPQKEFTEKNHTILQQIYEGLVRIDSDGGIEPLLAISWERIDPLTLEFRLRENVFFHNGEPFDSESVKFSIERYLAPSTGFPALPFISTIDRVEAIGPYRVRVVTKMPDGLLIKRLAGFMVMVPPRYIKEKGEAALAERPVGTGPFVFTDWTRGKSIQLSKNVKYWAPDFPRIEKLEFRFLPPEKQFEALLRGEVQLMMEMPGTMTLKAMANPITTVIKAYTMNTVIGHYNISNGPLADIRVRRAMSYAVNRKDLIRYDLLGNGREVASVSVPGESGHNPVLVPDPYDPSLAKKLLREAGVPSPLHIKMFAVAHVGRTASILRKQLERVGIILDISVHPDSEAIMALQEKEWDMGLAGLPNPIAHSSFPMSLLFYSKSPYSLLKDPDFDSKLETALATIDPQAQEKKFHELDKLVKDQALGLFTYQRVKTYGASRRLKFRTSLTGMPYFYDAEVKP